MFKKKTLVVQGRARPIHVGTQRKAAVFSYHASRPAVQAATPRDRNIRQVVSEPVSGAAQTRRDKRPPLLKRIPRSGFVVATIVLLVLNMFLIGTPQLAFVQSSDPSQLYVRPKTAYELGIRQAFSSSLLNRAKFSIQTARIDNRLKQQFPELTDIHVQVPFIGVRPRVYLQPAIPALLLATTSGRVYALDSNGRALLTTSEAPALTTLHLPTVSDQSGLAVNPGDIALPGANVAFITEVAGQLKAKQLVITDLILPKGTSELDVRISGVQYPVKFNLRGNAREEAGTYLAVKQQLERDHITPGSYMDVRVEGRAYYK